jgi:hypothetical protein
MHPNGTIRDERTGAHEPGELAGSPPAREIHLEETILCVDEAGCAGNILPGLSPDRGDTQGITRHDDWRREPLQPQGSRQLRQASPELCT